MREPVFVTAIYGERYAPFLLPHLYSIRRCYPCGEGVVLWCDLPRREIDLLARVFPGWRFVKTEAVSGEPRQRIPRKLHAWKRACGMFPDRPMAFLDSDTLLVRRLDEFFSGTCDIAYTWKDELFPINTGVMLASTGRSAGALLGAMADRVEELVGEPRLLEMAVGSSGAADQHALREIVGFCNYDRYTTRTVNGRELVFRGVPCRWLNETACRPIGGDLCVIHYKTGWHPILLEGRAWTVNRPEDRCREMFRYWEQTRAEAAAGVAREVVLGAGRAARDRLAPLADGYEERGILSSEMLAVCGVCESLGVEVIVESGRARGQSTWLLARYFRDSGTRLVSVELERDADAEFCEGRLSGAANVELVYGDSRRLLPEIIEAHRGKRMAVLLDGPKGLPAISLLEAAFAQSGDVVCGFIHDVRRETPQREVLEGSGARVFFTDDDDYVREFGDLDRACLPAEGAPITPHTWRPGMKGHDTIASYGPTLAVLLPDSGGRAPAPTGPGDGKSDGGRSAPAPFIITGRGRAATLARTALPPDAVPNRFLAARDWADPRYGRLREEFARLYRDVMGGEPHPYGARAPDTIVTHWSREWEYPWAALNARLEPGMRVADLGCGGSPLPIWLARSAGCGCTGIDLLFLSKSSRHNLRGFVKHPSELFPEVTWLQESMADTSVSARSQDRVFCISVLEHVPADMARATMREVSRVLRAGGLALITTDAGGEHRTLTSTYADLIEMGREAGLALEGAEDWTPPDSTPGLYDVVGFTLRKA